MRQGYKNALEVAVHSVPGHLDTTRFRDCKCGKTGDVSFGETEK